MNKAGVHFTSNTRIVLQPPIGFKAKSKRKVGLAKKAHTTQVGEEKKQPVIET